jgi:hypothetical protein
VNAYPLANKNQNEFVQQLRGECWLPRHLPVQELVGRLVHEGHGARGEVLRPHVRLQVLAAAPTFMSHKPQLQTVRQTTHIRSTDSRWNCLYSCSHSGSELDGIAKSPGSPLCVLTSVSIILPSGRVIVLKQRTPRASVFMLVFRPVSAVANTRAVSAGSAEALTGILPNTRSTGSTACAS